MSRLKSISLLTLSIFGFFVAYLYNRNATTNTSIMPSPQSNSDMSQRGAIVVGSGLAGLSAASQLISRNIPVRVLERAAKPGGNSMKASSGINGAPTKYQPAEDDVFYSDSIKSAGKAMASMTEHRESLIRTLTKQSGSAIDWLVDQGVDLTKVAQLGGHSVARTHRGAGPTPPGASIMTTLLKTLNESPLFHLQTSCAVTKVLKADARVTGVKYTCENGEEGELHGPVIFASGGFAGDAEGLLAKYRPDLEGYPSTNDPRPGTQPLLADIGAQLIDMDLVQVHPTGFVDPANPSSPLKFLAAEVLRGAGGILVANGKRFINELQTRENVTNAITSTPESSSSPHQWNVQLVLDEGVYDYVKSHMDFYLWKGLMKKTTISELGPDALATIKEYGNFVEGKEEDQFHRTSTAHWQLVDPTPESIVYVGIVTPVVHFTMGGALINEKSQVLDKDAKPIEGIWAAGEVAGGVHGGNRLGGSSLLECVVFGRTAGDQCAEYIRNVKE